MIGRVAALALFALASFTGIMPHCSAASVSRDQPQHHPLLHTETRQDGLNYVCPKCNHSFGRVGQMTPGQLVKCGCSWVLQVPGNPSLGSSEQSSSTGSTCAHHPLLGNWRLTSRVGYSFTPYAAVELHPLSSRSAKGSPWKVDNDVPRTIELQYGGGNVKHYTWSFGTSKDNLRLSWLNKPSRTINGSVILRRQGAAKGCITPALLGTWNAGVVTYRFESDHAVVVTYQLDHSITEGTWRRLGPNKIDLYFPTLDQNNLMEVEWLPRGNNRIRWQAVWPSVQTPMEFVKVR